MGKLKISLDFFGQMSAEFFYTNFPATFHNCVKIANFGKCENWKNIYNHRMVTVNSQPVVGHYAGEALTGDYPEESNQEGITASSR